MRNYSLLMLFGFFLVTSPLVAQTSYKVLIYSYTGEGFVHKNIRASTQALEEICDSLRVKTEVSDDPSVFESQSLMIYDAIIFANTNDEAFTNQNQKENFQAFIRSGKGFAGIHSASTSEKDWPWFRAMLGGSFVRHPKLQSFDIRMIDTCHISTRHLPKIWKWEDECYLMNHLNPDIHILFAADLTTLEDDNLDEFPGDIFGDLFPLSWVHRYDGGRQWYTALGHKSEHYADPLFREHLRGGIIWVLGMEIH